MTKLDQLVNSLTRLFAKTTYTMNPATIALIISLIEEAVKIAPGIYDDLTLLFDNPSPTPADWEALRAKVLSKSYADYVPASALAAASPGAIPLGVNTPPGPKTPVVAQPGAIPAAAEASNPQNPPPEPPPAPAAAAPADAPLPYLPDGSRNPEFNHLA